MEAEATAVAAPRRRKALPLLLLEGMRPRQWAKNAFVLAGVVFSGQSTHAAADLRALGAFAAFCLASGATYLFNDARDAEIDRHNPRTAGRPIARGDLSPTTATAVAAVAALASAGLALAINWQTLAVLGGYLLLQIAYSIWLKHILFVDVMAISAGFVLRALAGLVAISAVISPWLLLCTGLLALFIGLGKRRGEVISIGGGAQPQRPVLEGYSLGLVDELIAVVTPATLVTYSLYAVLGARTDWMLLTVPFVLYGIFRLLYLMHHRATFTEDPSLAVLKDYPLLICVLLWAATALVISALTPA